MTFRLAVGIAIGAAMAMAQPSPHKAKKAAASVESEAASAEDADLEQSLSEAGGSAVEYARALERHLTKYPKTARRAEIERVLTQTAIETKDKRRLIRFGVPVIEGGSRGVQTLDHVSRALLDSEKRDDLERAWKYSKLLEEALRKAEARLSDPDEELMNRGRRLAETDKGLARALAFQARAAGSLGDAAQAVELARRAWETYPSDEAGRELSRWLEKSGDVKGALTALAEADAASDALPDDPARRKDRARLFELAAAAQMSQSDVGLAMLAATDAVAARLASHKERLMRADPNAFAARILDFTLPMLDGEPVAMSSLKGKVVVLDFWATWCGPCRVQYPLYQETKKRFKDTEDVVFLAVNTDEDRAVVAPFLATNKWSKQVYFDDGLGAFLRVNSIPTTIVLGRDGEVYSRLNGFIRERFVDMLSERINEALQQN